MVEAGRSTLQDREDDLNTDFVYTTAHGGQRG